MISLRDIIGDTMGSLKLGIYCSVQGGETGWYYMHYKFSSWYFFPDKNCGVKRKVATELDSNPAKWTGFQTDPRSGAAKGITDIKAIADLSDHKMLRWSL
tara:strand:- start:195 stop:494 length:300 start_codon:yes stop_codon:yes gene_type:complete